ncbi:patatin-like phospholipase family protein [Anaeromyxobacter terrae]|uniref:patatin-like phospholipase family protein n=1 Tax=Anaeromyxobacter terrae TaxID=2925406 RepID=UPI001F5A4C6D|nr:patatin-like phospholipase family protein [Anaeromyxobacter sp. SG22]
METTEPRRWASLAEVLCRELTHVRRWDDVPRPPPETAVEPSALRAVHACIARHARKPGEKLSALCLSGGGIRSATFNLGVLQALARADVLHRFDYLSTVSGGGYVGAWLQSWIAREREEAQKPALQSSGDVPRPPDDGPPPRGREPTEAQRLRAEGTDPLRIVMTLLRRPGRTPGETEQGKGAVDDPIAPEPEPIDRLREFSNYLTPRTGPWSADSWTVVAIVLRNLLLNWLVIVPVIAAAVMVPQVAYLLTVRYALSANARWALALSGTALAFGFLSSVIDHWLRAEPRPGRLPEDPLARRVERRQRRRWRGWLSSASLVLLVSAATLFALATTWAEYPWQLLHGLGAAHQDPGLWARSWRLAIWTVGVPLGAAVVAMLGRKAAGKAVSARRAIAGEVFAISLSGFAAAVALGWLMGNPSRELLSRPPLFTVLALPLLLLVYVMARALFTALEGPFLSAAPGRPAPGDADREWWARVTGRVLRVAAAWAAVSTLVLLGTWLVGAGVEGAYQQLHVRLTGAAAAFTTLAGLATGLLGKSAETPSGRAGPSTSPWKAFALRVAAPATVAALIVLLAAGTAWLAHGLAGDPPCFLSVRMDGACWAEAVGSRTMVLMFLEGLGLVAIAAVAGAFVNVNRFSLHAMYRSRLVRAYLGASNLDRRPNPTTGFDEDDERLPLASLRPNPGERAQLFPIVNVTLNLVAGERLAWQERRAESFSMTPLFCGNFHEGYRPTEDYGGPSGEGVSLATAMAISGAAANPNMGYVSTPALTFLMALLNARLGVWLPNTNENGGEDVARTGPRHATYHLVKEMLGLTTRYAPFVNLSDGGHFDNLGLYEVVLRRCRFVVVSDAGCDPRHGFSDLGNALRKIRIDFGIPIEFEREIEIRQRAGRPHPGLYCAIARIGYDVPDGPDALPGTLVYVKPTVQDTPKASIPYDVRAYANACRAFPHESTVDQWFSESQFESYRALGAHLVEAMLGTRPLQSLAELEHSLRSYARQGEPLDDTVRALFGPTFAPAAACCAAPEARATGAAPDLRSVSAPGA